MFEADVRSAFMRGASHAIERYGDSDDELRAWWEWARPKFRQYGLTQDDVNQLKDLMVKRRGELK